MVRLLATICFCLYVSAVLGACSSMSSGSGADRDRRYVEHLVRYPGESLTGIASWYTGTPGNWRAVLDANPGIDPKKMRLGSLVRIPERLAVRTYPPPQGFWPSQASRDMGRRPAGRVFEEGERGSGIVVGGAEGVAETGAAVSPVERSADPSQLSQSAGGESATGPSPQVGSPATGSVEAQESDLSASRIEENTQSPGEDPVNRQRSRDELLRELLEE